jgi:TRAP-type C4-dicarboxylate transport system permease large subunit
MTPPVSLSLFIAAQIASVPMRKALVASVPFSLALILSLLLVTYVPEVSLALPRWLMQAP